MVPLRPLDALQLDKQSPEHNEKKKIVEQRLSFCSYPLHYNIINHRDKEKGPANE